MSSFLIGLVRINRKDLDSFNNYTPISSSQYTNFIIKTQQLNNKKLRSQVCKSFECLYYASLLKDDANKVIPVIDSLCLHLTLTSLAYYNTQESLVQSLTQSLNVFTDSEGHKNVKNESYLDFMVLIDAMFRVLSNDDSEHYTEIGFDDDRDK